MTEKTAKQFLVFLNNNPPHRVESTVNLIDSFRKQMQEKAKKKDWSLPVEFEDGEGNVVAIYQAHHIIGIVEGQIAPPVTKES